MGRSGINLEVAVYNVTVRDKGYRNLQTIEGLQRPRGLTVLENDDIDTF